MKKGQALISLLFFSVIAIIITSSAVTVAVINASDISRLQQGSEAFYIAESGAEEAIVRLLRDPSYSGSTLEVGQGTAEITVTGSDTKTILSKGRLGNFLRQIEVVVNYNDDIITISSWREIQ